MSWVRFYTRSIKCAGASTKIASPLFDVDAFSIRRYKHLWK